MTTIALGTNQLFATDWFGFYQLSFDQKSFTQIKSFNQVVYIINSNYIGNVLYYTDGLNIQMLTVQTKVESQFYSVNGNGDSITNMYSVDSTHFYVVLNSIVMKFTTTINGDYVSQTTFTNIGGKK